MKVYRYMSETEYTLMMSGARIVGKPFFRARTISDGVCFLPESVSVSDADGYVRSYSPSEAYEFMFGIVAADRLVEFEVKPGTESAFRKSGGAYASPWGDYYDLIGVGELCTPHYDLGMVTPLRCATPMIDWEWRSNPDWREIIVSGNERDGYIAEEKASELVEKFGLSDSVYGEKGGRSASRAVLPRRVRTVADMPDVEPASDITSNELTL